MLNKMKALIAQLLAANKAYYGEDDPIMTDLEYDRLYNELEQLEQETGIVLASSPTQRVSGEVLDSLTSVTHTKPMLSADKTMIFPGGGPGGDQIGRAAFCNRGMYKDIVQLY